MNRALATDHDIRLSLKEAMSGGHGVGWMSGEVARALKQGARLIDIDAQGVRFLDAAGLGELVACRSMAHEAGAEFRLSGVSGKARELLLLTGLDRRLLRGARRSLHELRVRIA
jgi:anti-anti-sigma factor